jgi:glycosyltransferase involved in cell wall biosynthesis
MRIIVSTGQGRLHLADTAASAARAGCNVRLITGYLPTHIKPAIVNLAGRMLGRSDLYRRLMLRCPQPLTPADVDCCSMAELLEGIRQIGERLGVGFPAPLFTWRAFARASRKYLHDADIFHVRSGAGCSGAIETARARGMKVIVDHSIAHPERIAARLDKESCYWPVTPEDFRTAFWKSVMDDCRRADVILVNSDYVAESLKRTGFEDKRIETIYLPVPRRFAFIESRRRENDRFRLLFTGGFNMRKGARILIEAMSRIISEIPGVCLEVYGTSDIPRKWAERCRTLNIRFHGHVAQDVLRQAMENSDAYVFPTLAEGCAKSVMEAMSAGLPVITTVDSGAPVEHRVNACVVETGSIDSLVNGILLTYRNAREAESWGRKASQTVASRCTEEKYELELTRLYQQLLSR